MSGPPIFPYAQSFAVKLGNTFDVFICIDLHSRIEKFTLDTDRFVNRSGLLTEALKHKMAAFPITIECLDPDVFDVYRKCVNSGPQGMEHWIQAFQRSHKPKAKGKEKERASNEVFTDLVRVYLCAKRMFDFKTANIVIEQIISFFDLSHMLPGDLPVGLAVRNSFNKDPLRLLLCDWWVYETALGGSGKLRADISSDEFVTDVALGLLDYWEPPADGILGFDDPFEANRARDASYYHLDGHDYHSRSLPGVPPCKSSACLEDVSSGT